MNKRTHRLVEAEVRRLGELFSDAAQSLHRIADLLGTHAAEAPTAPDVEQPQDPPAAAPNWDHLLAAAVALIDAESDRMWSSGELMQALRSSGVKLATWRGVPGKLIAKLRLLHVIRDADDGRFGRSIRPASTSNPPPVNEAAPPERNWGAIFDAALALIREEPERWWRPAELCRAIRERGIDGGPLRGMHLGLMRRLNAAAAISQASDGRFKLKEPSPPEEGTQQESAAEASAAEASPVAHPPSGALSEPSPSPAEEARALANEIASAESSLPSLSKKQRTAQICVWAGRARLLQQAIRIEERGSLRGIFGRLTALTRVLECDWIDALTPTWSTDWNLYIAYNEAVAAGKEPELPPEAERAYHRAILNGLFSPRRQITSFDAGTMILEALQVLPRNDESVVKAIRRFGDPERHSRASRPSRDRRKPPPSSPKPSVPLTDDVLAATRGKRALIAGGQGERDTHRAALQSALGLAELEWVVSERGKASPFQRLTERIRPGRYDFVLFLAGYTSHQSGAFVRACKDAAVPVVYVPRGYSVTSVVQAIAQQLVTPAPRSQSAG